jgi:hypothetical protein
MMANYTRKRVENIPKVSLKDKMKVRIKVTYSVAIEGGSEWGKLEVFSLSELTDRLSQGTLHETSKKTDYAEFLQRINGKIVTFLAR